MKRLLFITLALLVTIPAFAQDPQKAAAEAAAALTAAPDAPKVVEKPVYWTKWAKTDLKFTQTSLTNWAAGGFNTFTLATYIDANANYAKEKTTWTNRLQMDYGFLYSADKPIVQKNLDRIYFKSDYGYKTTVKNLTYTISFDFKTQFDNNYTYGTPKSDGEEEPTRQDWLNARKLKSGFLSPANSQLGIGIKWIPNKWLTINASPLTGGFVIARDERLRKNYGMELREEGLDKSDGSNYRPARFELGAKVTAEAKVKINNNISYETQLILFSNYLKNPQNLRVNWDNRLEWKLAKYFTMNFNTFLIYDDTIRITDDAHPDGFRAIQFKEFLQFGFTYTFGKKK